MTQAPTHETSSFAFAALRVVIARVFAQASIPRAWRRYLGLMFVFAAAFAWAAPPVATVNITVSANPVTSGDGLSAMMDTTPVPGATTFAWTVSNGSITSPAPYGAAIAITSGAPGNLFVDVAVYDGSGALIGRAKQVKVTVEPAPNATITAPSPIGGFTTGWTASVPAQPGSTFQWTINGGTITSDPTKRNITFNAGPAGILTLTCVVTNAAGTLVTGTRNIIVVGPPDATITAQDPVTAGFGGWTASVPNQPGATYLWSITNGTIDGGQGTNAITFTAGVAGAPLQLTCRVTNAFGAFVDGNKILTVIAPPIAVNDSFGTLEDNGLAVGAPGVLANDTDPRGGGLRAILVGGPSNGTLLLNPNGSFNYFPNPNFFGFDTFTYKVNDGTVDSITGTVTITVLPVNDAPTAANDGLYTTAEDTVLTVPSA